MPTKRVQLTPDNTVLPPKFPRIQLLPLIEELQILHKNGHIVRFGDVMKRDQRDFIIRCEQQLARRGSIRGIVLKARQIGMTTAIEAIAFVMAMIFVHFKAKIVAHENESSEHILGMTRRYWETYIFSQYYTSQYNGLKHMAWTNGSDINVSTAKNAFAGVSQTIRFLHASEVALWSDPEALWTGLKQTVPTFGLTAIFLESTARGVGNFFHRECNRAMKGDSEYEFFFYPWWNDPEYTAAYLPEDERDRYSTLGELDEEERSLVKRYRLDDGRLVWRRWCIANNCQGDVEKFHQEYPSNPHEAFISTGRNVFPLPKLLDHFEPRKGKRGRLIVINGRIRFYEDSQGPLTIFADPSDDRDWGVYLIGADPSHSVAGDFACAQVINRRTMEQVAVYRRKCGPIQFGKDIKLLGYYYNTALIAPEKVGPGFASIGVLCNPDDSYPYVFLTANQKIDKMQGFYTGEDTYGWITNMQSKHDAVHQLLAHVVEPLTRYGEQTYGLIIHDEATIAEMRDYVTTEKIGAYENSDGSEYDDGVMALAIAVTVHRIEPQPPAYEQPAEYTLPPRARAIVPTTGTGPSITSGTARPLTDHPRDIPIEDPPDYVPEPEAPWEAWGRGQENKNP